MASVATTRLAPLRAINAGISPSMLPMSRQAIPARSQLRIIMRGSIGVRGVSAPLVTTPGASSTL